MIKIICDTCKKEFETVCKKRKYCSKKCYYEMKRKRKDRVIWTDRMKKRISKRYKGKGNPMYGKSSWAKGKKRPEITGENHPNYKRGFYVNKDGYKIIEKRTREHRKIVEQFLGRKLKQNEIIHHINEDKTDNRIENLQIVSRDEHNKIHKELRQWKE